MKKYRFLVLIGIFYLALLFSNSQVTMADEVIWDGMKGTTDASVDRTVFYGSAAYSIKLNNLDYSCAYVYKDFEVKPNSHYRASVMVKYEDYEIMEGKYDSGASIGIKTDAKGMYREDEWGRLIYDFDTAEDQTMISLALWNGYYGGDCKGCAYFSDFQLNEIEIKWDAVQGPTEAVVDYEEKYPGCDYSIKLINHNYCYAYVEKKFSLKPNTRYVASVMAKNVDYELKPGLTGYTGARLGLPGSYVGTNCYNQPEWKKLEFGFRTDESGEISIALWNGLFVGDCKGTVYYSGFKMEEYMVNVEDPEGVSKYFVEAESKINNTIPANVDADYPNPPNLIEMLGDDGIFRVIYSDETYVYIDMLDSDFNKNKTLRIRKEMARVGTAVMDEDGNYYIVYGEKDEGETGTVPVMCVAKYAADGTLVGKTSYNGNETGFGDDLFYATYEPFAAASCDATIDASGLLIVRYGRKMYCQHQSSHSLYVDTKTMEKVSMDWNYTSHSYAQKVIATSDGGHLCAEMGDAYPRGMVVSKVERDGTVKSFVPFHFRSGLFYQRVYASIGGIAELSNGYSLVGSSVNKLSCKAADAEEDLESRNIFMQIFNKNFTNKDTSSPGVHLIKGEQRIPIETAYEVEHGCTPEDVDYGVKWITNYTDKTYASMVKMLKVSESSMLILWEKKLRMSEGQSEYQGTYYCIVASNGEFIVHPTLFGSIRISELTDPIYKNGYLYFIAVNEDNYKHGRGENEPSVYEISRIKLENPEITNYKEATCIEDGYTGDFTCKECGTVISGSLVPALGHQKLKAVKENEVAATTEKEGSYDEVEYCKNCNEVMTRVTKTIPKIVSPTSQPTMDPKVSPVPTASSVPQAGEQVTQSPVPEAASPAPTSGSQPAAQPSATPVIDDNQPKVMIDEQTNAKLVIVNQEKQEVEYKGMAEDNAQKIVIPQRYR